MQSLLAYIAPVALVASPIILGGETAVPSDAPQKTLEDAASLTEKNENPILQLGDDHAGSWLPLADGFQPQVNAQVRIERRVTIRIAPRAPSRSSLVADSSISPTQHRIVERKMDKCVPLKSIAGVQSQNDRLVLYMRDRKVVSARLEKKCRPRDFYAGFLVEKSRDGKLCVKRDELQARTGSKCKLTEFRRLVEVRK